MKHSKKAAKPKSKANSRVGRPTISEVAEREEALFEVATSVFLEYGYSRTSTNEIARRAGASKQTLYSRFPTKAALFTALIERRAEVAFETIAASTHAAGDWEHSLLPLCTVWVRAHTTQRARQLYEVIAAEATSFPELAAIYWEKVTGRAYSMLRELLAVQANVGRLEIEDLDWATEQLLGALSGTLAVRYTLGMPSYLEDSAQVDAWVRSVLASFLRSHGTNVRPKAQ